VADKLTPLLLTALTRAAAAPAGSPLTGPKNTGLFPNTAAAKPAMTKAVADGLLVRVGPREAFAATPAGLDYLAAHASPKQVLDDFVRVLEQRETAVADLTAAAARLADELKGLKAVVGRLHLGGPRPFDPDELADAAVARLADWRTSAAAGQDCPLPDLYRALACRESPPTVGQFHDGLRALHAAGRVYLHPWTGPLYAVPEPAFALLVGHNVAYYASKRGQ
jgi:hypothetical protein